MDGSHLNKAKNVHQQFTVTIVILCYVHHTKFWLKVAIEKRIHNQRTTDIKHVCPELSISTVKLHLLQYNIDVRWGFDGS
jgi:hypothetical protein